MQRSSSKKKTVNIKYLIDHVNSKLEDDNFPIDGKIALAFMLEHVLLENNVYNGFSFNNPSETDMGTKGYWNRCYSTHKYFTKG